MNTFCVYFMKNVKKIEIDDWLSDIDRSRDSQEPIPATYGWQWLRKFDQ